MGVRLIVVFLVLSSLLLVSCSTGESIHFIKQFSDSEKPHSVENLEIIEPLPREVYDFEQYQPEKNCEDGVDNDLDRLVDCADPDCYGERYGASFCYPEDCVKLGDEDFDGDENCADSDCEYEVCGDGCICQYFEATETNCADNSDNDIDSKPNCADSDCDGSLGPQGQICEPFEEVSCDDGFDNDHDNKVDCDDLECMNDPVCYLS